MTKFSIPGSDALLADLQLYKENDLYYMKVSYEYKACDGIHEITFPKVRIPLYAQAPSIEVAALYHSEKNSLEQWTINGSDEWIVEPVMDEDGKYIRYIDRIIKPAVHEMTLEEIEKKLGYKVKVISKKEKEK